MEHKASLQDLQPVIIFTTFNEKLTVHHHVHNRQAPSYAGADQSSPRPQISFLKTHFSIILPPMLKSYTFLPVSLPNTCLQIFPISVSRPLSQTLNIINNLKPKHAVKVSPCPMFPDIRNMIPFLEAPNPSPACPSQKNSVRIKRSKKR
jgi:hypothetical protein